MSRIYLTTTPNQRNFVNALPHEHTQEILVCDKFTVSDYIELGKSLPDTSSEIFVPYYGSVDGIYCAMELRKRGATVAVKKFYESLLSYHVHPWFKGMYDQNTDFEHQEEDAADTFIGIHEFNSIFMRQSSTLCRKFDEVYPLSLSIPELLKRSQRIFVGQPLPKDGSMSEDFYHSVLNALIREQNIDLYIKHPREDFSPDNIAFLQMEYPLECYREELKSKSLFMIFSTAGVMLAETYRNVTYIDVSEHNLKISPWAWKSYRWMLSRYPTIQL